MTNQIVVPRRAMGFGTRQRVDPHIPVHFVTGLRTRERIRAINIHCTRTANPLATGPPKGQRWIYLIFYLDECVENHRPAGVRIEFVRIEARLQRGRRGISIDTGSTHASCFTARRNIPGRTLEVFGNLNSAMDGRLGRRVSRSAASAERYRRRVSACAGGPADSPVEPHPTR